MEENYTVSKEMCAEKHNTINKELARHEDMLEKYTEIVRKQSETSAQIGELLKDSREKIKSHEDRIINIERSPNRWMERIFTWIGSGVIMGIIAFIFNYLKLGS